MYLLACIKVLLPIWYGRLGISQILSSGMHRAQESALAVLGSTLRSDLVLHVSQICFSGGAV